MDFSDSPQEAAFRQEVRSWLDTNAGLLNLTSESGSSILAVTPMVVESARAWQAQKAANRWAFIGWPEEYGGRNASAVQQLIWDQEEGRSAVPANMFTINYLAGMTLATHGTVSQRKQFMPRMLDGSDIWAMLFTERAAGSDLAGIRTGAVRDGDGWRVRGEKSWIWCAEYADWGTLLVRTDWDVPKHRGLTYFLLDMRSPGITISPLREMTGSEQFGRVTFDEVYVPDSLRVGEVGQGWQIAVTQLMHDRLWIGSGHGGWGGRPDAMFDRLLRLASSTRTGGQAALEDRGVRQRLADFYVELEGLRFTGYRMMTLLGRGEDPGPEASVTKLALGNIMQDIANFALELLGPKGFVSGTDELDSDAWQFAFLEAPAIRIGGGPDEIQRNIIADRVLKLPAERRADKDVPFHAVPSDIG